ncbi:metal ABC transporter ATP-binding protein [Candidatus Uhrbacteria bacterium]|nr:metal ABC transporter ATP-binding protein [Candidatus Uhrbacteria bacterium]
MIRVENLEVRFGTHPVLTGVQFEVTLGKIAAIIGPNGSGKTTLIRAMLGLTPIAHGKVLFDGKPLERMRDQIGYLPQKFRFDPDFPISVGEFLGLTLRRKKPTSLTAKLTEVGLSASILYKRLGSLSGGQLQRVLIAHATLHHPALLILDEPSTGIDIVGEKQFYELIERQVKEHHTTVLLVSHDIAVIAKVVDQVICVNKKLVCSGPPRETLTQETLSELYGHNDMELYRHQHPHL